MSGFDHRFEAERLEENARATERARRIDAAVEAERRRVLAHLDYYIARASNRLVDAGSNAVLRDIRSKIESGDPAP